VGVGVGGEGKKESEGGEISGEHGVCGVRRPALWLRKKRKKGE
jgi:hypothetical protein